MSIKGFTDKIYWRPVTVWHAFKRRADGPGYVSLCGTWMREKAGTQGCGRPPAMMRCAGCDIAEMKRRGWDESGPESTNWRDWL